MVREAERTSGFFESVQETRSAKSPQNREFEKAQASDKRDFERELETSIRHSNANDTRNTAVRERDYERQTRERPNGDVRKTPAQEAANGKAQETARPLERGERAQRTRPVEPNTQDEKTLTAIREVETENVNSSFVEVNLQNAKEFGFDSKVSAVDNIERVLRTLNEVLDLNMNTNLPIISLEDGAVQEEVVAYLAELLMIFRELSEAFLDAGINDKEVAAAGKVYDSQEAMKIGQFLQQETVKLELSFAELGISEEVAKEAVKINPNLEVGKGLYLAADLETRTLAQQILPKTVENILTPPTSDVPLENLQEKTDGIKNVLQNLKEALNTNAETANVKTNSEFGNAVATQRGEPQAAMRNAELNANAQTAVETVAIDSPNKTETNNTATAPKTPNVETAKINAQNAAQTTTENAPKTPIAETVKVANENENAMKTPVIEALSELKKGANVAKGANESENASANVKTETKTDTKIEAGVKIETKVETKTDTDTGAKTQTVKINSEFGNAVATQRGEPQAAIRNSELNATAAKTAETATNTANANAQTTETGANKEQAATQIGDRSAGASKEQTNENAQNSSEDNGEKSAKKGKNNSELRIPHSELPKNTVLNNEFVSPMRESMLRATEANIASPVALDGVSFETSKFSDSSEIQSVSPRFAKLFEKEIVEQVQKTILNAAGKNGTHTISLTLNPEKLGEIKLTIQVESGVVSARMNVENTQVKNIIEQNLQQLKEALAKQDLATGTLDVNVGQSDGRELQERLHSARQKMRNATGFNAQEGVMTDEGVLEFGMDTGRRFGNNSFEYFA